MKIYQSIILGLAVVTVAAGMTFATQNYVSLAGEFYVSHPDDWARVDFLTVDVYLARGRAGRSVVDYDAVIAPESSSPFFANEYVLIHIDTVGELSQTQVDSLLEDLSGTFGKDIEYFPVGDFLSKLESEAPNYDADQNVISVVSEVVLDGVTTKKLLLAHKLYHKGIASFYFYAPPDKFESLTDTFREILASFSVENLDQAHAREEVEIADVASNEDDSSDTNGPSTGSWVAIGVAIFVVIIAAKRRKKKRSAN
jgi:hypothetical protein